MDKYVFPKWTNFLRPALAIVLGGVPIYTIAIVYFGFSPGTRNVGYEPEQPVAYSHALHAGELGIDEFWIGDEGPAREPISVLAAAARATSRITLATGITNPYVRHPVVAAGSTHGSTASGAPARTVGGGLGAAGAGAGRSGGTPR